jgi:hypothetical protein
MVKGLICRSTDFRQFEQYLNVTGLDVSDITSPQWDTSAHSDRRSLSLAIVTCTIRAKYATEFLTRMLTD